MQAIEQLIGAVVLRFALIVSVDDRLTRMRAHLNELIRNENFEEAAVVRDEIKKVEGDKITLSFLGTTVYLVRVSDSVIEKYL